MAELNDDFQNRFRAALAENEETEINDEILKYINRLSDFLFVAARIENKKHGDILWVPNKNENLEE